MPDTQPWTIGRLLTWTTDFLKQHGSDSPRLDAEVLLAAACDCQRIELYTAYHELPSQPVRDAFRGLVRQRSEGTPVAYLVGHKEFYSLDFNITPAVLIPRPETELLVTVVLDLVKQHSADAVNIVDVGTGSGVIAVCLAKYADACHVTATDISSAALQVAQRNVQQHHVEDRVDLQECDLLQDVSNSAFDFIVSNPPYVSEQEFTELSRDVREHEPQAALVAGPAGTEVIARLIPQAAERLRPGGWLALEISPMIEQSVRQLVERDGRFESAETVKDLAKLARVITAQRKTN